MSPKIPASLAAGLLALAAPLYLLDSSAMLDAMVSDSVTWPVSVALCGGLLAVLLPGFAHLALLCLMLVWLVVGVGTGPAAIVAAGGLSAWSLGMALLHRVRSKPPAGAASATEAVLLGASIWLAVWGAMLHFPINVRGLYLGLGLLPLLWLPLLPAGVWSDLRARASDLHGWMRSIPLWAWTAGIAVIGWSLRWASFPSLSYDDHALHLRLWTELLDERRALFDVGNQIWAIAPFATDLLHAGLSLMADADARSAMNLALALALLALMARTLQRLGTPSWVQWLLVVLMASTPMLGNLLFSLQTEMLLAVVALAGLRLALEARGGWRGQHVLGVLASAALCAAIKLPGAVLGVMLLAALALRWWQLRADVPGALPRLRWPALLLLVPLGFVALHSYGVAWRLTGNPVFPLYNAVFHSPFAPASNFSDTQWIHGFSLRSYVRAFFETSRFFESGDFTAGWQFLVLLPLAIAAAWRRSVPAGFRLALLPLLGFGLIMFSATQYWRYLFPVMPIAGVLLAALFIGRARWWPAVPAVLVLLCTALNLYFYQDTSWRMQSAAQTAYTATGQEQLTRLYAPAAVLTAEVNRRAPGARVLYSPDAPSGATLHGMALYLNWYAPAREARFAAIAGTADVARFLDDEKVDFIILNMAPPRKHGTPLAWLHAYLGSHGMALAREGSFTLYRVGSVPTPYRPLFDMRRASAEQLLLPVSAAGITATPQPRILASVPTQRASQARYTVHLRCASGGGHFVAQINWDAGEPYYRLVDCSADELTFTEVVPVPALALKGLVYLTARDTPSAQVEDLQVELY